MLHNARDTMLVITVTGWRQDGNEMGWGQGHELCFCRILTPFEHHQPPHCHLGAVHSTMKTLILRMTKMVNALKEEPIQRHSTNNYTSMCHFFGFHFMPLRKLVLVGHISFTFVFSQMFWWPFVGDRDSHKTPFGHPKKDNDHNLQCVTPFKTWNICLPFYFKTKIKKISAREEADTLFSHHHEH